MQYGDSRHVTAHVFIDHFVAARLTSANTLFPYCLRAFSVAHENRMNTHLGKGNRGRFFVKGLGHSFVSLDSFCVSS